MRGRLYGSLDRLDFLAREISATNLFSWWLRDEFAGWRQ